MSTLTRPAVPCASALRRSPRATQRVALPGLLHRRASTRARADRPGSSQESDRGVGKLPGKSGEEEPIWVRREREKALQAKTGPTVPWALYLLGSVLVSIAAVGSTFEFLYKNPLFGVLSPDNPLWAPILLFFAVTGLPVAGYLFLQGVEGFNNEAERQDRLDGYLDDK